MKKINVLLAAALLCMSTAAFAEENIATSTPTIEKTDEVATVSETLKPKFDFDDLVFETEDNPVSTEAPKAEEKPTDAPTASAVATATPANPKEIKKVCGVDIPAGRYKVTGSGILKTMNSDGLMKSESVVSSNGNGIIVLLEDGDILLMNPLDGQEKAKLKFEKASTDPSAVTAVEKSNNSKTNPKTGDSDAELKIFAAVAAFALAAFAALELLKKRKSKNN